MTTNRIKPAKMRQLTSSLRKRFAELEKQVKHAEMEGQQINQRIRDLQSQCPHESTTENSVQDGAEVKFRTFCTDCGAQ